MQWNSRRWERLEKDRRWVLLDKVLSFIEKKRKVQRADLLRSFSSRLKAAELDEIIEPLVDAGLIERVVESKKGWRRSYEITHYSPHPKAIDSYRLERELKRTSHKRLQNYLCEMAEVLGKIPKQEHREPPYSYDVVWWASPQAPLPEHVFEIQHKGSLTDALAKLKHAKDIWRCNLFLIVTGERDRSRAQKLVGPYLRGTFHELAGHLTILAEQDIESLYQDLGRHRELLRRLLRTGR